MAAFLAAAALAVAASLLSWPMGENLRREAVLSYRYGTVVEAAGGDPSIPYNHALRLFPQLSEARLRLFHYRDRRLGDDVVLRDYRRVLAGSLSASTEAAIRRRIYFWKLVATGEVEHPVAALRDLAAPGVSSAEFRGRLSTAFAARLLLAGVDVDGYADVWCGRAGARILDSRVWRADRSWWLWLRVGYGESVRETLWQTGPDGLWLLLEDRAAAAN